MFDALRSSIGMFAVAALLLPVANASSGSPASDQVENLIAQGDVINFQKLLDKNPALLEQKDANGSTLLHTAAMYGQSGIVALLLKNGSRVDARDQNKRTPLHYIYTKSNVAESVARNLLLYGADIDAVDDSGETPLGYAAGAGSFRIAKFLVSKGAAVNHPNNAHQSPFLEACASGSSSTTLLLLQHGADINAHDKFGQLALHYAAMGKDSPNIARLLIARGANVDCRGYSGAQTPLFYAAKRGSLSIARYLISKGAKVNARDMYGMTPLMEAAQEGRDSMVKMLLANGADIKAVNRQGDTAEDLARNWDHSRLARFLHQYRRHRTD